MLLLLWLVKNGGEYGVERFRFAMKWSYCVLPFIINLRYHSLQRSYTFEAEYFVESIESSIFTTRILITYNRYSSARFAIISQRSDHILTMWNQFETYNYPTSFRSIWNVSESKNSYIRPSQQPQSLCVANTNKLLHNNFF